jgi:hypothetical protein
VSPVRRFESNTKPLRDAHGVLRTRAFGVATLGESTNSPANSKGRAVMQEDHQFAVQDSEFTVGSHDGPAMKSGSVRGLEGRRLRVLVASASTRPRSAAPFSPRQVTHGDR